MDEDQEYDQQILADAETEAAAEPEEEYYVEGEEPEEAPVPEAEAEESPEPVAAAAPTYTPRPFTPTQGESAEEAYLREQFGDEAVAAFNRMVDNRVATATQSIAAASAFASSAAATHPELFRVHGARINEVLMRFPASERGTKQGLDAAIALAAVQEAQETGCDFMDSMRRFSALAGRTAQSSPTQPVRKPAVQIAKAPVPPSQRPPSPSASPNRPVISRSEATIRSLMKDTECSRAEAEDMIRNGQIR